MVTGVMGVVFFVYNAVFALVLLLMVLVASGFALFTKNPDNRYQPMRDDRGSFIKSQTQLTTELDALGATARGEGKGQHRAPLDDDDDSFTSHTARTKEAGFSEHYQPAPPRSPDPSNQFFPSSNPPSYHDGQSTNSGGYGAAPYGRAGSIRSDTNRQANNSSPWQRGAGYDH